MIACQRTAQPDRPAPTWRQAINPLWLAGDINRPAAWGRLAHFLRNPFCNLHAVVLGVSHLPRVTVTTASAWTYAERGLNAGWTIARGWRGLFPLPLVSYRGTRVEWAIGWKTSGAWTLSLRRANSPNQEERP